MISVIVIIHNMPRQAENTLFSLSTNYQKNVTADDYEVIIIENSSDNILGESKATQGRPNFRYFLNNEPGCSPARAINIGLSKAKRNYIGLIIDGARILTPRVIEYAMLAFEMESSALVAVPGYHIGEEEQKNHAQTGHNEEKEIALLDEIAWKDNGYRLFSISCFGPSNTRGYLQPMKECNAVFSSAESFQEIGGADERFNLPGGGSLNLDIYRKLGMRSDSTLFVLPGEGSFHQFHHGVTTAERPDREEELRQFNSQLNDFWDGQFHALRREPILLGSVTHWAQKFLRLSSEFASSRFSRLAENKRPYWEDDTAGNRYTENHTSDTSENKTWKSGKIIPPKSWA